MGSCVSMSAMDREGTSANVQRDKSFGMLDQSPERWANFQRRVEELQASAPPGVQYKAFFLGRHGQGWHNFCSDKYGVEVSPLNHYAFSRPRQPSVPDECLIGGTEVMEGRSDGADCPIVISSNFN